MIDDFDYGEWSITRVVSKFAANKFANLLYGKGVEDLAEGFSNLQRANDDDSVYYVKKALECFENISPNDKKYVVASALFGKAWCHGALQNFSQAYSSLAALQNIEVGFGTMKKKTIEEFKSEGVQLEEYLKELERKLKKRKKISDDDNWWHRWRWPICICLFIVVIGIVIAMLLW